MSYGTAFGMYPAAAFAVWVKCASWICVSVCGLWIHSQYCITSSGVIVMLGVSLCVLGLLFVYFVYWHFGVGMNNFCGLVGGMLRLVVLLDVIGDFLRLLSFA